MEKNALNSKVLVCLIILLCVFPIASNFYKYFLNKNYPFLIEAPCSQENENCFVRDCSSGECPPNELEYYKQYYISAADFEKCIDDSCADECSSEEIKCEQVVCGELPEDTCS